MKVCSKCKIDKDDKDYYTYFHSTQNKFRTRNICQQCMNKQKKDYKLKRKQLNNLEDNPDYKKCRVCDQYKLIVTEYYKSATSYQATCKVCALERDRVARLTKYVENSLPGKFLSAPNEYVNDFQKEQVFILMKAFGWIFNEDTKIWSKPGVKDKDGNWSNLKVYEKRGKYKPRKKEYKLTKLTYEAIVEYRKDNLTYNQIGKLYGVSGPAVRIKLLKYERQNRGGIY
jgi:hypothetical protein